MNAEDNVVNFQAHRAARGQVHGQPYTEGSAAPVQQPIPHQPAYAQPHPPVAPEWVPSTTPTGYAQFEQPAAAPGTELVPARRHLPARRSDMVVDPAELARRAERRANRRRKARTVGEWLAERSWWVVLGLGETGRAVWRVVWQPDQAAAIKALEEHNPDKARQARTELRRERRTGLVVLASILGGGYFALYQWGDDLLAVLPWWSYPTAAAVLLPSLALAGRPEQGGRPEQAEQATAEMPQSLTLDASDRGAENTLVEAFADISVRAQIGRVTRAAGGWGWTAVVNTLDEITEAKIAQLERYLNTPVGGVVMSPVIAAARARDLRIVMADLLSEVLDSPEREWSSSDTPDGLGRRFDGGRLVLDLTGGHILIVGRTQSGKSGVVHDVVDALTAKFDVTVDGLDITEGPDLRAWEKSLRRYVGGPDFVAAEKLLADVRALVEDRTARLGASTWDTRVHGPAHVLVIDEYGLVAEHARLRELVEYVITYGAKVRVFVVLCAQRKVKEMMRSALIASQVAVKIYLGMNPEDVAALPKAERELGVRPHLFRSATKDSPNDAGKGFVLGQESMPVLARFDRTTRETAVRRAAQRAPHRPQWTEQDQAVLVRNETNGLPKLVLLVRDAIVDFAGANNLEPQRASGEAIVAYLARHGQVIDKNNLVSALRTATDGLINRSRDTNLGGGKNPKGLYLEDIERALSVLRQKAAAAQQGGGRG